MGKAIADTNVIVGFLTGRDTLLDAVWGRYEDIYVSGEVLCEVIYIMTKMYSVPRAELTEKLFLLLRREKFVFGRWLTDALFYYRDYKNLGIVDACLLARSMKEGMEILTADKDLYKLTS